MPKTFHFTEDSYEQTIISLFKDMGYEYHYSPELDADTGSAQSQITIDDLKRLSLKLPPLEEQKRITEILSSIDYKIELNRRINDNLMPTYYA